jgi:hypothetical protein
MNHLPLIEQEQLAPELQPLLSANINIHKLLSNSPDGTFQECWYRQFHSGSVDQAALSRSGLLIQTSLGSSAHLSLSRRKAARPRSS